MALGRVRPAKDASEHDLWRMGIMPLLRPAARRIEEEEGDEDINVDVQ